MKGPVYRIYREGSPHHVFTRGIGGAVIFYSTEDCIYYLTLYSCLAREYGIKVRGFSIMPNHTHSNEEAASLDTFRSFHGDLSSQFTVGYNLCHKRSGKLFDSPFGYSAKTVGKKVRDNLCYIANNAVVGKLAPDILSYRWNLLPYFNNDHPFSERIDLSQASRSVRRAVDRVKHFRAHEQPLDYIRQEWIFRDLSNEERKQITDYIIARYHCLDYTAMTEFYKGSFQLAIESFRANSGSEHDIPEDYENYGIYAQMLRLAEKNGIDLVHCNFQTAERKTVNSLSSLFREYGFPSRQIDRFLQKGSGR